MAHTHTCSALDKSFLWEQDLWKSIACLLVLRDERPPEEGDDPF